MKTIFGLVAALGLLTAGQASASAIEFFGEDLNPNSSPGTTVTAPFTNSDIAKNQFFAAVAGLGVETFESFTAQHLTGLPNPRVVDQLALTFGATGVTGVLDDHKVGCDIEITQCGYVSDSGGTGRQAISSPNFYLAENAVTFDVTFNQLLSAFGFYGTDVGDKGAQIELTLWNGNTQLTPKLTPASSHDGPGVNINNGGVMYYGFYVTPDLYFDRITFGNTGGLRLQDVFGFDNFAAAAAPVPEPASLLLLGTGVVALARRRRAKKSE